MSLPQQTPYQVVPVTSGVQKTVNINFEYLNDSSFIQVTVNGNIISTYSLSGNLITFDTAVAAPATIIIKTIVPYSNPFNFTNYTQWNPANVNAQFDNFQLQLQQLATLGSGVVTTAIQIPLAESGNYNVTLPIAANRAGKAIKFDNTGNAIVTTYDPDAQVTLAQGYATQAANSATLASNWAQGADSSLPTGSHSAMTWATTASNYATNSSNSATLSSNWAQGPDSSLPGGAKSAMTWALAAQNIVIPNGSIIPSMLSQIPRNWEFVGSVESGYYYGDNTNTSLTIKEDGLYFVDAAGVQHKVALSS